MENGNSKLSPSFARPAAGLTLLQFIAAAGIIGFGSYLTGALGFGIGMIAAPLLMLVDPVFVPAPILIISTAVTVLGIIRDRTEIDFKGSGWALAGRVPGTAVGAIGVAAFSAPVLGLAVSLSVLFGVLMSSLDLVPRRNSRALFLAGALSGLMSTLAAIGGPPMVFIWQGAPLAQRRAALAVFFTAGSVMSVGALLAVGAIDRLQLMISAVLAPVAVASYLLGVFTPGFRHDAATKLAALALCTFAGLVLLAKSILAIHW